MLLRYNVNYYSTKQDIENAKNKLNDAINSGDIENCTSQEFSYAILLVHNKDFRHIVDGIEIFKRLSNIPTCKRDAVYYIALGYFRLKKPKTFRI
ncbi:hypothetical protein HZS_5848 [Henneguya salminicola]|nr:hypothetical protein HZS_5848 [Henneguya salminicola]